MQATLSVRSIPAGSTPPDELSTIDRWYRNLRLPVHRAAWRRGEADPPGLDQIRQRGATLRPAPSLPTVPRVDLARVSEKRRRPPSEPIAAGRIPPVEQIREWN